jgi:hypothetical protein
LSVAGSPKTVTKYRVGSRRGAFFFDSFQPEPPLFVGVRAPHPGVSSSGAVPRVAAPMLLGGHFLEGQSLPFDGHEIPVFALCIRQRISGLFFLFGSERAEKRVGSCDHFGRGFMRAQQRRGREEDESK